MPADPIPTAPRLTSFAAALALTAIAIVPARAALVGQEDAVRIGLARAWYNQADVGGGRGVAGAALSDGRLLLLTEAGRLQAFDAETGAAIWSARVGSPGLVSLGPSASDGRCAVVNGASVIVFDAETGAEVMRRRLLGAPGAAPAVSADFAFVPLLKGLVEEAPLDSRVKNPRLYASAGATTRPPSVVGDYLLWTTQRGFVYGADATHDGIVYRFFTAGQPLGPVVGDQNSAYVATREGRVYGIRTGRGAERWRTSVGGDVERPAVLQSGVVYVGTEEPALYAIDASTGAQRWIADGADRFVAASAKRVYALGPDGALAVIDAESGRVLDRSPSLGDVSPVVNTATDRMYLVSSGGAIQALREAGADRPFVHAAAKEKAKDAEDADEAAAPQEADPFKAEQPEAPAAEDPVDDDPFADPFADPTEAPAEQPAEGLDDAGDDPFGDDPFDF